MSTSQPSSNAAPSTNAQSQEELQAALRARLIQSGEYEKLLAVFKTRLEDSGWEDQLRGVAREKARAQDPPNLQGLVKDIEPVALDTVPQAVRSEIEAMIKAFVEKNVED